MLNFALKCKPYRQWAKLLKCSWMPAARVNSVGRGSIGSIWTNMNIMYDLCKSCRRRKIKKVVFTPKQNAHWLCIWYMQGIVWWLQKNARRKLKCARPHRKRVFSLSCLAYNSSVGFLNKTVDHHLPSVGFLENTNDVRQKDFYEWYLAKLSASESNSCPCKLSKA